MSRGHVIGLLMVGLAACGGDGAAPPTDAASDAMADAPLGLGDISPSLDVISRGPRMDIAARFRTPAGAAIPAEATMSATFRDSTLALTRYDGQDFFTGAPYTTFTGYVDLTTAPAVEGEPVEVALSLGGAVATSMATMPAGFTIDSVSGSLMSSPMVVTWSPTSTDRFAWTASAQSVSHHSCSVTGPGIGEIPDTGTLTIDTTMVWVNSGGFPCGVIFDLDRSREGTLAAVFPGGAIGAHQTRQFWPTIAAAVR